MLSYDDISIINNPGKAQSNSFDSVKTIKEIDAINELYKDALSKSDSIAVSNIYTADAEILND